MNELVRGTTPTIRYTFPVVDTSKLTVAKLVIEQGEAKITKELAEGTVEEGYVEWTLTQSETLSLTPNINAVIKLDWKLQDGTRGIGHTQTVQVTSSAINEVI